MNTFEETKSRHGDSLIPNTQIEAMFLRVCTDPQMERYVKLCDDGHISLATAYASNIIYKLFYILVERFERDGGSVENLTKHVKTGK